MAQKKSGGGSDDGDLWARFTRDIEPTRKSNRMTPTPTPEKPAPDSQTAAPKQTPPRRIAQPGPPPKPPPSRPSERGHGDTPGVDGRTAAKLKRGLLPIDGTIDLHGQSRDAAQRSLTRFIEARQAAGARCILVITGKGLNQGGHGDWSPGVLRQAVPEWLNAPPLAERVLGFSYAQPRHGGSGALYVLLRRQR